MGRDLAGKQIVLAEQQVIVVVVECHRHAIIGEHQKGQCPRLYLVLGHQMADQGLKEGFIRNPGGREKAHHVAAAVAKTENGLDRAPPQAPPLAADLNLQIGRDTPPDPQLLLQCHRLVEKPFVATLIEPVAIDKPLFADPGLDPIRLEEVKAFDEIRLGIVQEIMRVFGRFDRHAIARQHVKMGGAGKGIDGRAHGQQRRGHQAPRPPAAFHALARKGDCRVVRQRRPDHLEIRCPRPCIKMD